MFGIIKSVLGFRQFSLRGLQKVTGKWTLVCPAWNLKRMAVFVCDDVGADFRRLATLISLPAKYASTKPASTIANKNAAEEVL